MDNEGKKEIDFTDCPVTIDGTAVKKLTMREPTVGDQLVAQKAAKSPMEVDIVMMANLCEVDEAAIHAMKLKQYRRMEDALRDFIG